MKPPLAGHRRRSRCGFQFRERIFNVEQEEIDLFDLLLARRHARRRADQRFRQNPSVRVERRIHAHEMAQRGRGIDLNIAGQLLPGWTVTGSYTRTKYALLTTTPTQYTVARQPRDTYSLYSHYRTKIADGVTGGMSAGLYGRSSSYADVLGLYVVPAARQIDVNGFLSIAGFDLNLGIRNIFDRRNYNTTTSFSYVPVDEPRNVRLTITKRLF